MATGINGADRVNVLAGVGLSPEHLTFCRFDRDDGCRQDGDNLTCGPVSHQDRSAEAGGFTQPVGGPGGLSGFFVQGSEAGVRSARCADDCAPGNV